MNDAQFNQLRVALLALLPKDGTPVTVADLARSANLTPLLVTDALFADYMAGRINFDVRADAFSAVKQGDKL